METYTRTVPGRLHRTTQDSVVCDRIGDVYLLAVCDGMGGHPGGRAASQVAAAALRDAVAEVPTAGQDDGAVLETAVRRADTAVRDRAGLASPAHRMGTTVVTALVRAGSVVVCDVGDSRAYVIDGGIDRVTQDHLAGRNGNAVPEEVDHHPRDHVLTRALGAMEPVDPDRHERQLGSATLLLCSDGLSDAVDDDTLRDVVATAPTLAEAGDSVVARATDEAAHDDVAVVLARPS